MAEALAIMSGKDDLDAIDFIYEIVKKEGEPAASIRSGSELTKFLLGSVNSLELTVVIRDEMIESSYSL